MIEMQCQRCGHRLLTDDVWKLTHDCGGRLAPPRTPRLLRSEGEAISPEKTPSTR